jgi:hypothetical protein
VIETPDDGGTLIHVKPVGDGRCTARFWHGPGHQSSTRCDVIGLHDVHRCTYGESDADAAWRDGGYTGQLRAKGIKFNPRSYPENMGMSGYFDEPTEDL